MEVSCFYEKVHDLANFANAAKLLVCQFLDHGSAPDCDMYIQSHNKIINHKLKQLFSITLVHFILQFF